VRQEKRRPSEHGASGRSASGAFGLKRYDAEGAADGAVIVGAAEGTTIGAELGAAVAEGLQAASAAAIAAKRAAVAMTLFIGYLGDGLGLRDGPSVARTHSGWWRLAPTHCRQRLTPPPCKGVTRRPRYCWGDGGDSGQAGGSGR
jgi:hypothetical protein